MQIYSEKEKDNKSNEQLNLDKSDDEFDNDKSNESDEE